MEKERKDLRVRVSFTVVLTPEAQDAWMRVYGPTGPIREDVRQYFTPDGTSAAEQETGSYIDTGK